MKRLILFLIFCASLASAQLALRNPGFLASLQPAATGAVSYEWVTNVTTGAARNNADLWVGCYFTADSNITVTALGRWVISGNSQSHTIRLLKDNESVMASATVDTSGATPGQFKYTDITPVTLTNGQSYVLASREFNTGDQWYDVASGHIVVVQWDFAFVTDAAFSNDGTTGIDYASGGATTNSMYVPVSFKFQ